LRAPTMDNKGESNMANRSYLYSIDFDPTTTPRDNDSKVCGLSEWPYAIPFAYLLLVSQDAKACNSIIFGYDKPIAIMGDFYKGRQRLLDFMERLEGLGILEKEELEWQTTEARAFLNNPANQGSYIVLECGEIFDMADESEGALEELNERLLNTIKNLTEDFILEEMQKVENQQARSNLLGISFWSDVLYYS